MASSIHGLSKGGANLPVPSIILADVSDQAYVTHNPSGVNHTFSADGKDLRMSRMPLFSANEIPEELFSQDLRLEVLWYTKKSLRSNGGGGGKYTHPRHTAGIPNETPLGVAPIAPMLPASRSRGGKRTGFDGHTTEWSITFAGQRFFIDSLGLFFVGKDLLYVDSAGNQALVLAYVPANVAAAGGYPPDPKGFGYCPRYRPAYFKFRFSIQDPSDPRARITGAHSRVVVMASRVMPFLQDAAATQAAGQMRRFISAAYVPTEFNTWFETRLPSTN